MVIAVNPVCAHVPDMANRPQDMLSDNLAAEMRPEKIGYRLKLLREGLGMKPAQISDMLGIERTYWSRFERGHRAVSDPIAALLVDRFGVTLDFLILGHWDKLPLDLANKMRQAEERLAKESQNN